MAIRNATKAVVVQEGKILLIAARTPEGKVYYDLPGGGQLEFETMEQAVVREVLEETGYSARVTGFLALGEEINLDEEMRRKYPGYVHRVLHIFQVALEDVPQREPSEADFGQTGCVWVSLEEADTLPMCCPLLRGTIGRLVSGKEVYLGSCERDGWA